MATRSMPFWPRPATTSGSSWPGSGLCAPFSGRLSWSGMTRAAPPPHPPERSNNLFHRRLAVVTKCDGPLTLGRPDPAQDRLQADAVLIRGPDLNRFVRVLCRFLGNDRGQLF